MQKNTIFLILICISILGVFIYRYFRQLELQEDETHAAQVKKEFPDIKFYVNNSLKLSGVVVEKDIKTKQYLKGAAFITLNNGQKFSMGGETRNFQYEQSNIMDFVQVKDSLDKISNSDYITIYRGELKYYFKIGSILK